MGLYEIKVQSDDFKNKYLVRYSPWGCRVRHNWVRAHAHTHTRTHKCKCIISKISTVLKNDHPKRCFYIWSLLSLFSAFTFWLHMVMKADRAQGWRGTQLSAGSLSLSLQFSTSLTISTCPYGLSPGIRIFKAILSLNSWADMQQCSGHCELNKHKVMFLFSRNLWSHWKLWNYT